MQKVEVHTKFKYENKWIRYEEFQENNHGERHLVKTLKSDLIDRRSAFEKEASYRKMCDDIKFINPIQDSIKDHEIRYHLPAGSPLWNIIKVGKLNTEEKLKLAKDLIHIVLSFHKHKLLFIDLSWNLFWYDELDQDLYLLDATMVTPSDHLETKYNVFMGIESDMYTISPEQTFQSSSIPDVRSNYYSLAIILYALFTGEKPFKGEDRVAIIHKHLHQLPDVKEKVSLKLPPFLEGFIKKLLAKNPSDRYQSALGLASDFNMISDHILKETSLKNFELGRNDFPLKFTMPENIFVREDIIQQLIQHTDQLDHAKKIVVLMQGEKGVDSDSIINQYLRLLNYDTYYIGSGKFTTNNDLPYSGLIAATSNILDQLFMQDETVVESVRKQMDESISELSGVLVTFNSRFQNLFYKINTYQELSGLASINRFIYAYTEFLRIIQNLGKPIIMSLQNYHLADVGTNKLLEQLMKSSIINNLLVLLTYERNKKEGFISVRNHFDDLLQNKEIEKGEYELRNFNEDEVIAILDQLKIEPKEAFGKLLYQKTKGSPSFIKQLFEELISSQQIKANSTKQIWEIDLDSVENINLSENVFQFLSNRLNHLSSNELDLLKHASVIGHHFKLSELKPILNYSNEDCDLMINDLRSKGFLNPVAYKNAKLSELRFSHPGFVDTFGKIISKAEYDEIKLKIINHNYLSLSEEELNNKLYELVNHILSLPAEKCKPFRELLTKAAVKAKNEAAFSNAGRYYLLISEIEKLNNADSDKHYDNYYESTLCSLSALNYETYQQQLKTLESIARKKSQKYKIFLLKAIETIQRGNLRGTIDNLEQGLKFMGLKFSKEITQFEIIKIFMMSVYKSRKLNEHTIESIPFNTDEKLNIAHQLINISSPAVYFLEPKLSSRLTWLGIKDTVEKGLLMESPSSLLALGFTINSFSDMVDKSVTIAKAGLKLLENKIKNKSISVACNFLYGAFVQHLVAPLDDVIESLDDNYKRGREAGNTHMAFYCLGMNRWYSFFNGTPLNELRELIEASHQLSKDTNQIIIDYYHRIIEAIIQELTRGSFYDSSMEHNSLPINYTTLKKGPFAKDRIINCNINMAKLIIDAGRGVICYDEEVFHQLFNNLKEGGVAPYNSFVQIFYIAYHILKGKQDIKGIKLKDLDKYIKNFKVRAEYCPVNYATKYFLIEALRFATEQKHDKAFNAFSKAHVHALENKNNWDAALVCEEFGIYLINRSSKAAGLKLLSEAIHYYEKWGATSIVERLKSTYPEIKSQFNFASDLPFQEQNSDTSLTESQVHEIVKVSSQVLGAQDLQTQLSILLDSALQYSDSGIGKFIIIDDNRYQLFATKVRNQNISLIEGSERLEEKVPLSILRLISRRRDSLILSNISGNPQFRNDPYIQNHRLEKAILIPIVKNNQVKSILLLENSLTKDKEIKINFLEALCSQVGLAIDNSILTELLEEKLEERAKQIQEERDKSDQLLRNILPAEVAKELKLNGKIKARKFDNVSVLFTDFKDFSKFSERLNAEQIIEEIDKCYKAFDTIVEKYNIEKIKTIGDAYMCAGGIPSPRDNHEEDTVSAALEMIQYIENSNAERVAKGIPPLEIRAGIHSGPVIAGIVGSKKYAYDIWGPTVNIAARMESSGKPGRLNVSGATYLKIKDKFNCEFRGQIKAKSVGAIDMYFVEG